MKFSVSKFYPTANKFMTFDNTVKLISPSVLEATNGIFSGRCPINSDISQLCLVFLGSTRYTIVGTDFNNYLILYFCNRGNAELYVQTRKRHPSVAVLSMIYKSLHENGLSSNKLVFANQNNC